MKIAIAGLGRVGARYPAVAIGRGELTEASFAAGLGAGGSVSGLPVEGHQGVALTSVDGSSTRWRGGAGELGDGRDTNGEGAPPSPDRLEGLLRQVGVGSDDGLDRAGAGAARRTETRVKVRRPPLF